MIEDKHMEWLMARREQEIQDAYELGLLHGINAQSLAQAKNKVLEFDDLAWEVENE